MNKQPIHKKALIDNYVTLGRVLECFTNNIPSKKNIFPGNSGVGAVYFEDLKNISEISTGYAKPYFPNIKYYPLKDEVIWIIQGPEYSTSDNVYSRNLYYVANFNSFNSPHINPHPIDSENISFGKTYYPKDIQSLIAFEGDFILEGRWGNSIRFGSSISSSKTENQWSENPKAGDPILIIRNGQTYNTSSIDLTLEDINFDSSSLYFTTSQKIPIDVASKNMSTFNFNLKPVTGSIFIPNNSNNFNTYDNVG